MSVNLSCSGNAFVVQIGYGTSEAVILFERFLHDFEHLNRGHGCLNLMETSQTPFVNN